ncbi:MAG: site-specific integrase [Bdellovibrionales bacterium]|nr:site-specific integrase [Bdellovibrionales bacterium]
MAIKSYHSKEHNEVRYQVYVNVGNQFGFRAQKRIRGIESLAQAQKLELAMVRECTEKVHERKGLGLPFGKLVDRWELDTHAHENLTKNVRMDYIAAMHNHCQSIWKRPLASITRGDILDVLRQLKLSGATDGYRARVRGILHRLFEYAIDYRMLPLGINPCAGIKIKRKVEHRPEILTKSEIQRLLKEARNLDHPWYRVWAVALLTGMRNGELYALTWDDIDWENEALTVSKSYDTRGKRIKCTKSGEWRTVPISSELMTILKGLQLSRGGRKEVLPRLVGWNRGEQSRILRQFTEGIGLPRVKFHTLRACFATQLIRQGVAPIQIQKICGWRDLETMQRYVRLAGIEIKGVTEGLKILPEPEVFAKVIELVK